MKLVYRIKRKIVCVWLTFLLVLIYISFQLRPMVHTVQLHSMDSKFEDLRNGVTAKDEWVLNRDDEKTQSDANWEVKNVIMVHVSGNLERFMAIQNTWFKSISNDLGLMLIAGERCGDLSHNFISSSAVFGGAFGTTKQAFAVALRSFPFASSFAKFDDDTYVYTRELIKKINLQSDEGGTNEIEMNATSNGKYWGYPMKYNAQFVYASGGAGYVLNRRAAIQLYSCSPPSDIDVYEDVAVGYCMSKGGIDLIDLVGLHPHHPYQMIRWDKFGHPSDRVRRKEILDGYMNPLSYHYMLPSEMIRMHDNIYLHGFPFKRSIQTIPRIIHQFWEGDVNKMPNYWMHKCRDVHAGWDHFVWNENLIRNRFPSGENHAGMLKYDGSNGELVNIDFYKNALEKNLLSDIVRYEVLMFFGGLYIDADTECFRPIDALIQSKIKNEQGFGFIERDLEYMGGLVASGVIGTFAFSPLSIVLVSELQAANWNEPPWVSAGPMYFTRILKLFKGKMNVLPPFWDVQILDSVHVYPYHHSDEKPLNLYHSLLQKGSVMDQKWGTTHGLYKHDGWKLDESSTKSSAKDIADDLPEMIRNYIDDIHLIGLSTLAKPRPRWVVAAVHPLAGMCNRMMHIISSLAFAMATGRVLLFDWNQEPANLHPNQREFTGHSNYEDIFKFPGVDFRLASAIQKFGFEGRELPQRVITDDQVEFLHALRWSDLDSVYPESIIRIERYDWWGAPLTSNELYRDYVFHNKSSSNVFSTLFRFLFQPKIEAIPRRCDWLIQHRSKWERSTPGINAFIECGGKNGMQRYGENTLVSDSEHEIPGNLKEYISHVNEVGCRNGLECDISALKSIHSFSSCSHAVLTATSTFGACITGLGLIKDVWVVQGDGKCTPKKYVDPIDAGTLDSQIPVVSNLLLEIRPSEPKFAFVYMMIESSEKSIVDFQNSVVNLHQNFNTHHHYPIVLFVDDKTKWRYLQFVVSSRVHLIQINWTDWMVPDYLSDYPETFYLRSIPEHRGFSLKYRQMSRYAAGFLLGHPSLSRFDYVIKLDSDTQTTGNWNKDPFLQMFNNKARFGFWISYSDIDDVTEGLWEAFVRFVKSNKLTLKQPELLMDSRGKYLNTNLYGCFIGAKSFEFRSAEYKALFRHFDLIGGFFKYRWDEQKIFAFYVAIYLLPSEVEFFDYIVIEHQTLVTPSKLQAQTIPSHVIEQIFGR